jgi:hypothetical protein
MIKCPNCGSAAQVKYIGAEKIGGLTFGEATSTRTCTCGCGAIFEEIHVWQYVGVKTNLIEVYKDEENR